LSDAYTQVRLIEAIRNIPAQRTKLFPFLYESVEEAQPIKELLPNLVKKSKREFQGLSSI